MALAEKRLFKRYPLRSGLTVNVGGMPFKAETIDYSLAGLGLKFMDNPPPVGVGNTLEVNFGTPPKNHSARVMWIKNAAIGLSMERPIEGALEDFDIADVFIGLQRGGKTGVFEFQSGRAEKKIFLREGDMVYATSNLNKDGLAVILHTTGRLTDEQYHFVLTIQRKTGKRQGTILIESGFIKPAELPSLFRRKVEEIIISLFSYGSGRFFFRQGPLPAEDTILLRLSGANLVYRGLKRISDVSRLRGHCPKDEDIIGLSADPLDLFQDIAVDESDKKVLSIVDGKTPFKYLLSASPLGETDTLRTIYALMSTRMLEIKERPAEQSVKADDVLSREETDRSVIMEAIEEMYERCERHNYFELLGVRGASTDAEVRNLYYRLAREFHPDLHFHLPVEAKAKLNSIFGHLSAAYAVLKTPQGRLEHLKSLRERESQPSHNANIARARFDEGKDRLEKGELGKAELLFAEAKYFDARQPEYRFYYGVVLMRLAKFKEAEKEIKGAYLQDPDNPDILAELGHAYIALGFPTRAKGNFERALKLTPSHKRAEEGMNMLKMRA